MLEPTLIFFTLGYPILAIIALIFFTAYMVVYLFETRTVHSIRDRQRTIA